MNSKSSQRTLLSSVLASLFGMALLAGCSRSPEAPRLPSEPKKDDASGAGQPPVSERDGGMPASEGGGGRPASEQGGTEPTGTLVNRLKDAIAAGETDAALALLRHLADSDLDAALATVRDSAAAGASLARDLFRALLATPAHREAVLAWGDARAGAPGTEQLWAAAVDDLAGTAPEQGLAFARRTQGELRAQLTRDVFLEWAGENLAGAKAALAQTQPDERMAAHVAVAQKAFADDAAAAMQWIHSMGESEVQDALYLAVMPDWAARDAKGASRFVDALTEHDYKTVIAGRLTAAWAASEPEAAVAWGSALPDQESREEALGRAMRTILLTEPRRAADLAIGLPGESDRFAAVELVVSDWIDKDAAALREWADSLHDLELRSRVKGMIADHHSAASGR